ncbi:MAG: hypothetical protein IPI15_15095 [Saprospiraceae bacterium]|uniref:hypothetical protein n=1 Tax=Candidatus Brachybacter algidus TaxID=2982024 RepID=UPI002580348D|nr:hypothetical protein [Candidatus Brachybacter algidus]MBK7604869.1 hypothetical protein [Candidatus Brachybacter algidus]
MSALSTRIFIVGLGETKSLNSAIKYFKNLDKKYNGLASPFYFDKVLKHNGKFFWNPFIPIFFGDAFEKYIVNEFEQLKEDVLVQSPGVSFLDFSTCGSKSRLNTTIDLLLQASSSSMTIHIRFILNGNSPNLCCTSWVDS